MSEALQTQTDTTQTLETTSEPESLLTADPVKKEVPPDNNENRKAEIDPGNKQVEIRDDTDRWKDVLDPDIKSGIGKFHTVEDLARGYLNVQKLVGSNKIAIPSEHATEEDWHENVYSKIGRPQSPDKYKFTVPENSDEEITQGFKSTAFDAGLNDKQAQKIVDWFNQSMALKQESMQSQKSESIKEQVNSLKKEWGTAFESKIAKAQLVVREYASDDQLKYLAESGLTNDTQLVRLFASIGEKILGEDKLKGDGFVNNSKTPQEAKQEIANIHGDSTHPYHNKNHPNHSFAVKQMAELFKDAYPSG